MNKEAVKQWLDEHNRDATWLAHKVGIEPQDMRYALSDKKKRDVEAKVFLAIQRATGLTTDELI